MCGIVGLIGIRDEATIEKMAQTIIHRGPDQDGFYFNDNISLANRRLSIIDLNTGKQPVYNEDKSIVVVYNGEIYNFQSLREKLILLGHKFYTNTDTEIIVHAYEEYGLDCVKKFNGDFVFAIHDENKNLTFIARDRLGIRPLYYSKIDNLIIFASELKAILTTKYYKKVLNPSAIDKYLSLRYSFGTETFFNNIYKLPPASIMTIKDSIINVENYWKLDFKENKLASQEEYIDKFDELFTESVKLRMISDVPFGAFLSGGIDSSLIVSLMARNSDLPIETYSIGFNMKIDELNESQKLASYLGCNHHEIIITDKDYNLLPEIVKYFDEPLGDAIIIPTYILAKEASKNIKVVLTGEGADEIFGSYVHQYCMHYGSYIGNLLPETIMNNIILPLINMSPLGLIDSVFPYPSSIGKNGKNKLLQYLKNIKDPIKAYFSIASIFNVQDKESLYTNDFKKSIENISLYKEFESVLTSNQSKYILNKLIDIDQKYWLPDYTLFKQDRITMANSIEGRIPYLDHNLVEFVSSIPVNMKLKGLSAKYLLRKMAEKYLPYKIASKPKKAFYFPFQNLFKEDFNQYLKNTFHENSKLVSENIIKKDEINNIINKYSNSELLSSKQLMSLIILEHWLEIYL